MNASYYGPYSSTTTTSRWLLTGFVAGALAVLVFHQGTLAMLHAIGLTPRSPYGMQATAPFGIPQIWSTAFWGGVWGVILALALRRLDGPRLVFASIVFGAVAPTLVAWFVVAPLKGQPMAGGFAAAAMATGLLVNAAWGLGTGALLLLFGRSHVPRVR
jgi:hypothetical protein